MKIKLTDATDDQINAAIARLEGWTCSDFFWWPPDSETNEDYRRVRIAEPPDYLHDWALCGPLLNNLTYSIYSHLPKTRQSVVEIISEDGKFFRGKGNTTEYAICLAYLAMHFPDGMIEVDDETTS